MNARTKTLRHLVVAALLLAGCSQPSPTPVRPIAPQPVQSTAAAPDRSPEPSRDVVRGTPGAFCDTSRLGKRFVKGGVAYVCKGPKPYRWRRAS